MLVRAERVELAGAARGEDRARPRGDALADVFGEHVGVEGAFRGERRDGEEQDALQGHASSLSRRPDARAAGRATQVTSASTAPMIVTRDVARVIAV
jgi:hypothetical protein